LAPDVKERKSGRAQHAGGARNYEGEARVRTVVFFYVT
jgi:hypothetical protein